MPNIARRVATPNFGPKISNSPYKVKTKQMGALLVATDVLSTRISFFLKLTKKWPSYGPKRVAENWARSLNLEVFGP